jgi:hypothetical protein
MKTYIVKFSPNETAPAGELGKADYFGFIVEARDYYQAAMIAKDKFDRAFGRNLTENYRVESIDLTA